MGFAFFGYKGKSEALNAKSRGKKKKTQQHPEEVIYLALVILT